MSAGGSPTYVPTIALTQDGRPRILYASDGTGGSPLGYHYLECNANCTSAGSWTDLRLTTSNPIDLTITSLFPRPHLPFAVSPGGRAAFGLQIVDPNTTKNALTVLYCSASCATAASWKQYIVGNEAFAIFDPQAVAFGSDLNLQLLATEPGSGAPQLVMHDCTGDCSLAASWSQLAGIWTPHDSTDLIQAEIARTAQGGTRIAIYADSTSSTSVAPPRNLYYTGCDSGCLTALTNWKAVLVPTALVPNNSASVGFGLALDVNGEPALAYVSDTVSGYVTCTGDCTSASGIWQATAVLSTSDLNTDLAPLVPASCGSASWGMYVGPALTLNAQGKPVVGMTAQVKAFGGQCGSGSAATTTDGIILLPH